MLVHCRVTPSIKFAGAYLYTWMEEALRVESFLRNFGQDLNPDPETRALTTGPSWTLSLAMLINSLTSDTLGLITWEISRWLYIKLSWPESISPTENSGENFEIDQVTLASSSCALRTFSWSTDSLCCSALLCFSSRCCWRCWISSSFNSRAFWTYNESNNKHQAISQSWCANDTVKPVSDLSGLRTCWQKSAIFNGQNVRTCLAKHDQAGSHITRNMWVVGKLWSLVIEATLYFRALIG